MEDKPRFMSGRWQWKLMRERPIAFSLLCAAFTIPVLFVLRLGLNGGFGGTVQTVFRVIGVCLLIGLLWLIVVERRRWKERNSHIDAYLEQRYEQTHAKNPPSE